MIKISRDPGRVPKWLNCKKSLIPDFVAENPKVSMTKYTYAYLKCNKVEPFDDYYAFTFYKGARVKFIFKTK